MSLETPTASRDLEEWIAQLSAAGLDAPWTRLAAPDLTPELRERVVRGCAEEAGSRSITDLVRERDRALVDILRVLGKAPDG